MFLRNIQEVVGKAPMLSAAQSAARELGKVEAEARRAEEMERARQAEEMIRELHQAENEPIRNDQERTHDIDPEEERRRQARMRRRRRSRHRDAEDEPPPEGPAPFSEGHLIDVTV